MYAAVRQRTTSSGMAVRLRAAPGAAPALPRATRDERRRAPRSGSTQARCRSRKRDRRSRPPRIRRCRHPWGSCRHDPLRRGSRDRRCPARAGRPACRRGRAGRRDGIGVLFVGEVRNGNGGLVRAQADLAAPVGLVRPTVEDALCVVGGPRVRAACAGMGETAGERRVQRFADVHDVRAATARLPAPGPQQVRETGFDVNRHVHRGSDAGVESGGREFTGLGHVPELPQVEHLHSVPSRAAPPAHIPGRSPDPSTPRRR